MYVYSSFLAMNGALLCNVLLNGYAFHLAEIHVHVSACSNKILIMSANGIAASKCDVLLFHSACMYNKSFEVIQDGLHQSGLSLPGCSTHMQ